MTKDRAAEIIRLIEWKAFGCLRLEPRPDTDITPEEDKEIHDRWRTMNGNTCYHDAARRIWLEAT